MRRTPREAEVPRLGASRLYDRRNLVELLKIYLSVRGSAGAASAAALVDAISCSANRRVVSTNRPI